MTEQPDTPHDDQASDHTPPSPDFAPPPPRWPKPIGVISIVLGILAMLGTLMLVGMILLGASFLKSQLGGAPLPPTMQFTPVLIALTAIGVLINFGLVFAGAMLVLRKPTARPLHLAYALISILGTFAGAFYQFHSQAAIRAWASDHPSNERVQEIASDSQSPAQVTFGVVMLGVALIWPVFCIIWFGMIKRDSDAITGET